MKATSNNDDFLQLTLAQRLDDVAHVNLDALLSGTEELRTTSNALRSRFLQWRRPLQTLLSHERDRRRFVRGAVEGMQRFLTRGYQYIDLADVDTRALERIYGQLSDGLAQALRHEEVDPQTNALSLSLRRHHQSLQGWVQNELRKVGATMNGASVELLPPCENYSPQTQLEVLTITVERICAPILDLGCGFDGALTKHLQGLGFREILGIDHNASSTEGLIRASWFEAPLPPDYWSLIVAHQSYSLHFLRAHLTSSEQAAKYATHYVRILKSLRLGGYFSYAPNLPFFEPLLAADRYKVAIHPRSSVYLANAPAALRHIYAVSGIGSTTIQRIA